MGRLFGTDGVRGVANKELTGELAYKLGQAGAYVLAEETHHTPKILVGLDTRISGDLLEKSLVAGICSVGSQAICLGVIPTPAIAHLIREYEADAGVVISASHNPFEFNGIKFFNNKGYKLSDDIENRIESIILDNSEELPVPIGKNIGFQSYKEDAVKDYVDFVTSVVDINLDGMRIAIDCANGASYKSAPMALEKLGASVLVINNKPNGVNINCNCGSTHIESLQQFVVNENCALGLAFDGDADRVLAVDEKGDLIDGDQIMAIIGLSLKEQGKLNNNTIVATVMSNLGLYVMAEKEGIKVLKTKVGDRYVLEQMLENNHILGGEQSGHIIFLEHNTTGDGLLTGLQLIKTVKNSGKTLSQLAQVMDIYPQVLRNARVSNEKKKSYMEDNIICEKIKELENVFDGKGRVLIRPSGTEPLVRVMIEGKDQEYITNKAEELAKLIENRLL